MQCHEQGGGDASFWDRPKIWVRCHKRVEGEGMRTAEFARRHVQEDFLQREGAGQEVGDALVNMDREL